MSYRYCDKFGQASLTFNGRIDVPNAPVMAICCEMIEGMPTIPFGGSPESILQNFIGLCSLIDNECRTIMDDKQRVYTAGCMGCKNFIETDEAPSKWDGLIHSVNISSYPAPCQSHCFYCWVHDWDERFTPQARAGYEKMIGVINLAEKVGLINSSVKYQVSSGEIAVHPYRMELLKLVKGKPCRFCTNCMKYDSDIAQNLHDNPQSSINLSIDSGTPETWAKVKGVDNFETTIENLTKYYMASISSGQITIKYIVFPDINDNYADFVSLMEILKVLEVKELSISRDGRVKYNADKEYRIKLLGGVAYLSALCLKNGIKPYYGSSFAQTEILEINDQIEEIIQKDLC